MSLPHWRDIMAISKIIIVNNIDDINEDFEAIVNKQKLLLNREMNLWKMLQKRDIGGGK